MKEGWEYSTIGKLCKTYSGGTPLKNVKEYYQDGNIPWLRSGEVCQKYIYETEMFITQKGLESSSAKYYPINTVVVAMYGATAAQVGILKLEATSNQAVCGIIPNSKFLPEFLYYFFCYRKEFLASQAQGGAQPNISQVKIKNLEVPVPSFSEQQSIVDYLDSAFAKIDAMKANAEKALNEAKTLFQASLKEMLEPKEGWEENKLKEICETITDFVAAGSFASLRENVVYNNEKDYAQLVRTTDLKSGFSKGGYVYVNEHAFKYLYRVNLDKECIILPNVGVNCGEVYYVTPSILPYNNNVLGPNAVLVRSSNYNNHFLSYLFLGKDFQNKLSDITSHMAQPKFNKTGLKEIVILVPPLSEQQSIVATLDSLKSKVDRLQANYDKISQECDALKQAILRQVFCEE